MAMAKRWWWIGAIVVVVGLATYMLLGRGTTAPVTAGGGSTTPGTSASGTVAPGATAIGTKAPGSGTKAEAPKIVVKGAKLATVTVPPTETIAQIKSTASRDGRVYDARFRVYGIGPSRGGHGTVVALLDKWMPRKAYSDPLKLAGKNILLELGSGVSVSKGGSYSGVVKLMKRGSAIVFTLTKATAR